MLFKMKIDEDIELVMLQLLLARPLFDFIDSDREHLQKWLPALKNAKTVKDQMDFIAQSLTEFANRNR